MLNAAIFDLDGVLIQTELETFRFYQKRLLEFGVILPDAAFKYKAGRKSRDFFRAALSDEDCKKVDMEKLLAEKRELFNTKIDQYARKIPGGKELVQSLHAQGVPLALASQNEPRMITSALRWLEIEPYFSTVLSLDDIEHKKPHPEIYELALKRLQVKPQECVVIEDSLDGLLAAKNAGLPCIRLHHEYMPEEVRQLGDAVAYSLFEVGILLDKYNKEGLPLR